MEVHGTVLLVTTLFNVLGAPLNIPAKTTISHTWHRSLRLLQNLNRSLPTGQHQAFFWKILCSNAHSCSGAGRQDTHAWKWVLPLLKIRCPGGVHICCINPISIASRVLLMAHNIYKSPSSGKPNVTATLPGIFNYCSFLPGHRQSGVIGRSNIA